MSALDFYIEIVKALDEMNAPYMMVGAFGGLAFGMNRATFDIDMIVDLKWEHIQLLAARFPSPRYYADPELMRNSMRDGIIFNIIDSAAGSKADLVPLTREPGDRTAFARRVRRTFEDEAGTSFEAWCAQPTDIIIGKLKAWTEGRSAKHPADIHAMLVFALSGLSDVPLNLDDIALAAARLGRETGELWNQLLARARDDIQKNKNNC